MMNLVCLGKYPIHINELSTFCADPVVVLTLSRTYIELTLHLQIFRWLNELLIPNKTTNSDNFINNHFLTTYERFNRFSLSKYYFTTHQVFYGTCWWYFCVQHLCHVSLFTSLPLSMPSYMPMSVSAYVSASILTYVSTSTSENVNTHVSLS